MGNKELPIPLDKDITRIAIVLILVGSLFIRLASWTTAGWMVIAFGLLTLWLAYQVAIAPEYGEEREWFESSKQKPNTTAPRSDAKWGQAHMTSVPISSSEDSPSPYQATPLS